MKTTMKPDQAKVILDRLIDECNIPETITGLRRLMDCYFLSPENEFHQMDVEDEKETLYHQVYVLTSMLNTVNREMTLKGRE